LTSLGRAREATNDTTGALDAYTQAAALDGPFRTDARLGAGRMHEAAGHAAEARAIYAELLKDTTDADLRALLTTKVPADESGEAKAADAAPAEPVAP
jgi:predicted TPR repeat methyltransferase